MTENQINYQRAKTAEKEAAEKQRANLAQEAETRRHNLESEKQSLTKINNEHRIALSDQYGKYGVSSSPYVLSERERQSQMYPDQSGDVTYASIIDKVASAWEALPFKIRIGGSK